MAFSHTQRVARAAGRTVVWATPRCLFDQFDREFAFTVDAAAHANNALLPRFWDEISDGLAQDWSGERVWCNPPYGRGIGDWTRKAAERRAEVSVLLVPVRSDTEWWHRDVLPAAEIRFLRGRVKFVGSRFGAPFPVCALVYRRAA